MKQSLTQALASAKTLWAKEPARVISVTAAVIVFLAAKFGVIVPVESVTSAVAFALPLLLGGELIRSQVSPVASLPALATPAASSPAAPAAEVAAPAAPAPAAKAPRAKRSKP